MRSLRVGDCTSRGGSRRGTVDEDGFDAAATLFKLGDRFQHRVLGLAGELFELAGLRHEGEVLAFGDGVELADLGHGLLGLVALAVDHGGGIWLTLPPSTMRLRVVVQKAVRSSLEGSSLLSARRVSRAVCSGCSTRRAEALKIPEFTGELAQHAKHLAHVAGALAQGFGQLGELLVVGIEGGLELFAPGDFGGEIRLALASRAPCSFLSARKRASRSLLSWDSLVLAALT